MTEVTITRHGESRMSQRGIRQSDLDILLDYGTEIGRNRIMLKNRIAAEEIRKLKKQISDIERLKGKVIVVMGKRIVTAYHQTKAIR